jgi:hypothetical protein
MKLLGSRGNGGFLRGLNRHGEIAARFILFVVAFAVLAGTTIVIEIQGLHWRASLGST